MKKEKNKLILTGIISLILSVVLEMILVMSNTKVMSVERVIVLTSIISFIVLNFVIDRKKLYDFISSNRYKIGGVLFLITTLFGISFISFSEESVILGDYNSYNYSMFREFRNNFYMLSENVSMFLYVAFCNLKMILAIIFSYELSYIISKDKMIGVWGAFIIAFSSYMLTELNVVLIFGELAICLIYKFLTIGKEIKNQKVLYGALFVLSMMLYGFWFDLSTVIAFGYIMIAMFIAFILILKNDKKIEKNHIKTSIVLFVSMLFVILVYHLIMVNTGIEVLDINNTEVNKMARIMGYGVSVVDTFKPIQNPENWTSFISVFPMPIILALVYMYKKESHFEFLFPLSVVMVLEILVCSINLPGVLGNILGFAFVSKDILAVMIALINVYMMIYIISNLKERSVSFLASTYLPLVIIAIYYFMERPVGIRTQVIYYFFVVIMVIPSLLISNYTDVRYKKAFCFVTVLLTILAGITVNPITNINYFEKSKNNEVKDERIDEKIDDINSPLRDRLKEQLDENVIANILSQNNENTVVE